MSTIIGNCISIGGAGGGTAKVLEYSFTGNSNRRLDDDVVELLSTGVLTVPKDTYVDAFIVGAGASGNSGMYRATGVSRYRYGGAGGSSGTTKTLTNILLQRGVKYQITIGAGGSSVQAIEEDASQLTGNPGGDTVAFGYTVKGGQVVTAATVAGSGGSGGGTGARGQATSDMIDAGTGGSDGNDGGISPDGRGTAAPGQGFTTREFGELNGKLYAAGGGGGRSYYSTAYGAGALGGDGGGGNGAIGSSAAIAMTLPTPGEVNTGSGGGGGGGNSNVDNTVSGAGGSGIVCIRFHKDDPEFSLGGTWKFNNTIEIPSAIVQVIEYVSNDKHYKMMFPRSVAIGLDYYYGEETSDTRLTVYKSGSWIDNAYKTIKFWHRVTTVSEAFYNWFTSNATKVSD